MSFLNIGKAIAEEVFCGLHFPNAEITERAYTMSEKPLEYLVTEPNDKNDKNTYTIKVDFLNEGQGGSISVAINPYSGVPEVEPSLFGRNVNGMQQEVAIEGKVDLWKVVAPSIIFGIFAIIVAINVTKWYMSSRYR